MAPSTNAASTTERVMGPAVSQLAASGMMPARLTTPTDGFTPTWPAKLAGEMTLPAVSEPIVAAANDIAIATADPELEPLGLLPSNALFT